MSEQPDLTPFDIGANVAAMINRAQDTSTMSYSADPHMNTITLTVRANDSEEARRFQLTVNELPPAPTPQLRVVGPIVDRTLTGSPPQTDDFKQVPDALNRIASALAIALQLARASRTAAEKNQVIDTMVRALTGSEYDTFVNAAVIGFSGWINDDKFSRPEQLLSFPLKDGKPWGMWQE
jgi:hypothetical protein